MSLPSFIQEVPDNGYRWWYLDAVSDDGNHALTVIVFIGSVFSPYYAWARKRGAANAQQYCSINVVLYGKPSRWCMTERTAASMQLSPEALAIGRSEIRVDSGAVIIDIDEIAVPLPGRVRGRLTVALPAYEIPAFSLDNGQQGASCKHFWQPVAPKTRISVEMESPALHWQGNAYMDSNNGEVPLESTFKSWTWSRSHADNGDTTILYDVVSRDGHASERSLRFDSQGRKMEVEVPFRQHLESTRYFRIPRQARTEPGTVIEDLRTLEDAPFYSRSSYLEKVENPDQGSADPDGNREHRVTIHETLDLDRFDSAWVRCMLPFRMPRRTAAVRRR
ncbi:MAG: carotenoid 1,2-hydratase [Granulosicoccus sp.]